MSEITGFRRLRSYMMALFIPLTGVPLLILAGLAYVLISEAVDWTPLKNANIKYTKFNIPQPRIEDVWQFTSFLIHHQERLAVR